MMACLSKPCGQVTEPISPRFPFQFVVVDFLISICQMPDSRRSRSASQSLPYLDASPALRMPENDGNLMKSASAAMRRMVSRASHWLFRETIAAILAKMIPQTLSQNSALTGVQFRS
jgi:hypothetical protein